MLQAPFQSNGAVRVDRTRQREGAVERAEVALVDVVVPLLVVFFALFHLLAGDREDVVLELDRDVLFFQPRKLGGEQKLVVGLGYADGRIPAPIRPKPAGRRRARRRIFLWP